MGFPYFTLLAIGRSGADSQTFFVNLGKIVCGLCFS